MIAYDVATRARGNDVMAGIVSKILTGTLCSLVARAVMGLEQVKTEIVLVIAPH